MDDSFKNKLLLFAYHSPWIRLVLTLDYAVLGLNNEHPGNEMYEYVQPVQESEERIIETTKNAMLGFGLEPEEKESRLALMYQNPKFH